MEGVDVSNVQECIDRRCSATWTTQSNFHMACDKKQGHAGDHSAKVTLRDGWERWTCPPEKAHTHE